MSRELIKQLKNLKKTNGLINPDRAWVLQNRAQMMESIKASVVEAKKDNVNSQNFDFVKNLSHGVHIFVSRKILSLAHAGVTMMLIAGLTVGSWIAGVSASSDSLPGEIMYGVKMATESTELLVVNVIGSEETKVSTVLKHASTRVDEIQRSTSPEQASQAMKSLQEKIETSSKSLDNAEKESPEEAVAVAKVIETKTEEILNNLVETESKNDAASANNETQPTTSLEKELSQTQNLVQQANIKAVEVMVQKVETNQVSENVISKEEVKEKISKKLDQLVADVSKLDQKIVETSKIVASSTVSVVPEITSSTLKVDVKDVTAIPVSSTVSVIAPELQTKVEEASKKVEETNKIAETAKTEVQGFIDSNNLTAAMEKLKELGGVKNETQTVVQNASIAVKEVVASPTPTPTPTVSPVVTETAVPTVSTTIAVPPTAASGTAQTAPTAVKAE